MQHISDEEKEKILNSSPIGTWALIVLVSSGMVIAWLFLYYGVFIPRGMVN